MRRCRTILAVLCGGGVLAAAGAGAQQLPGDMVTARSRSGQFVVLARRADAGRAVAGATNDPALVRLDPMLLPVSCERIKQQLYRQLGVTTPWAGKVYLALHPGRQPGELVTVTSEQFNNGWQYRVDLPEVVERGQYVRAVVQALLQELANRNARERAAELPAWLIEGLTAQLLASSEIEIILRPPTATANGVAFTPTFFDDRRPNPLQAAHAQLANTAPLSFEALSWPTPEQLSPQGGEVYRRSAQLFLNELLGLNNGRACLCAMLERLPQYHNWQFAFLGAFDAWFQRPLDVEKWWTLRAAHFTGHSLDQVWLPGESREKLLAALKVPVQIQAGTNNEPVRGEIALQAVIRGWETRQQAEAIGPKLQELTLLQLRAAPAVVPLVQDYHQVLQTYLRDLDHPGLTLPFRKKAALRHAAERAVKALDALDARLAKEMAQPPMVAGSAP